MYVRVLLPPSRKFVIAVALLAVVGAFGAVGAASALSGVTPAVSHVGDAGSGAGATADAPLAGGHPHGGCHNHHWL